MATAMSSSRVEALKKLQKKVEDLCKSRDRPSDHLAPLFESVMDGMVQASPAKDKLYREIHKWLEPFGKENEEILRKLASILDLSQEDQGPTSSSRQEEDPSGPNKDHKGAFGKTSNLGPQKGQSTKIDVKVKPVYSKDKPQGMSQTVGPTFPRIDKDVTTKDDEHWKKIADDRLLELNDKQKEIDKLNIQMKALKEEKEKLVDEVDGRQKIINGFEEKVNEAYISEQKAIGEFSAAREVLERTNMQLVEVTQHAADVEAECRKLYHKRDKMKKMIEDMNYDHQNTVRKMSEEIDTLTKSRDDLRDRFSKVAGQKLNENNPDIADLSDPDRAMKLAERFSAVYDDQWTDAFQEQQDKMKKRETKDIVGNLLEVLKVCYKFCEETAKGQMLVLQNVFLHPCQGTDLERNPTGGQAGQLAKPRIKSTQEKMLKDLRRKIASDLVPEVKVQFLAKMRKDEATEKKAMQYSMPYYEKCVEICWLMVLHDPPLHIDVDVQPGARMDSNIFTSYQTSGNVIEYLVWPPLYNGKGGGLLSKGTAQPTKK